jgi:hypothetical protein
MSNIRRNNITFLLTQDLESPSGLGRYLPLAKNLSKQGILVSILALHANFEDLKDQTLLIDNVKITYVAQMHVKKEKTKLDIIMP